MNLASILSDHDDDKVALIDALGPMTYGELRSQSASLRGGLLARGLKKGERVAIVCGNTRNFVVSYLAIVGAGLVAVPLNPLSPTPELQRELSAVAARGIVVGPAGRGAIHSLDRDQVESLVLFISCPGVELEGAIPLSDLLTHEPSPLAEVAPDDLAVLIFTSGTAGPPKAAMLTHGNLEVNQCQTIAQAAEGFIPDDTAYCVLPLFHIFGLNSVLGTSLRLGATVLLVERFDPNSLLQAIAQNGVSLVVGPPTLWLSVASLPEVTPAQFEGVRVAVSGAAKLTDYTVELVERRLGIKLSEGYGLTEASPSLTTNLGLDSPRGSVGRPLPAVEIRIVDADGDDVLIGDAGEILARGPNIFAGYWQDDEATSSVLDADGWLHTGDIGVVDERGFISIIDRAKDLIIVSGFNVYPAEVEDVLESHAAVSMAAVVGIPHPHSDEAVKAIVVLEPDSHTEEDELISFARTQLAAYKCPVKIDLVSELPTGPNGKVLRRELS